MCLCVRVLYRACVIDVCEGVCERWNDGLSVRGVYVRACVVMRMCVVGTCNGVSVL